MYTLSVDEKVSQVMVYTLNTLVRGELVTRQNVRVSVWLRTEGAPDYLHILKPQIVNLSGSKVNMTTYSEMYLPTSEVISFHLTPPVHDPMDYDETEMNRFMQQISVLVGSFVFNGAVRVSTQVDLGTSIVSGRAIWQSIYDVKITNPHLPEMGEVQVPMLVVKPRQVCFALSN